jgi:hypothetical protein
MHFMHCEHELRRDLMARAQSDPKYGNFTFSTPQGNVASPGVMGPFAPGTTGPYPLGPMGPFTPGGMGHPMGTVGAMPPGAMGLPNTSFGSYLILLELTTGFGGSTSGNLAQRFEEGMQMIKLW